MLLGKINLDPLDGEGRPKAITALLNHVQDTAPAGSYQPPQNAANAAHQGDPALDTAQFDETGPGNLRVDYVLPAKGLHAVDSGVIWPAPDSASGEAVVTASEHHLVWVDLDMSAAADARQNC